VTHHAVTDSESADLLADRGYRAGTVGHRDAPGLHRQDTGYNDVVVKIQGACGNVYLDLAAPGYPRL
jgi:hypothetical protein